MFKFAPGRQQSEALSSEVARLQEKVQRLQARIRDLQELADNDELVGLPNRRSFFRSLEKLIHKVSRYDVSAAVIFIDVDGLKQINDSCGHAGGDDALVQVARTLVACLRQSDSVGRLSGDEFGILLEGTDELGAWQMALRVVEHVAASKILADGRVVPLSVAVGVGMIRSDDTALEAISRADAKMYELKRKPTR